MNASRDDGQDFATRSELRRERRGGLPRALGLTTLSAVLPGAGLVGTRGRVLGWVAVVLAVAGAVALAVYAAVNGLTSTALETASDTGRLRAILAVVIAGTVLWIALVALTAVLSRPRPATGGQKTGLTVFTALLCLAVSAPAALAYRYIDAHVDAVDRVFPAPELSGSEPTSLVGDDPDDPWAELPRVNVLLLGSDAAEAREGTRTDTMIVLSVDTATGDSVQFSVPRNLQNVPIPRSLPLHELYPQGYNCGDPCLMNAVWTEADAHAEEHPELYADDPNPGLTATREVLSTVLGLPIHQTVIVNLQGFEDLIDAMGGVVVNVQERIPINARTYTDWEGHLQIDPESPNIEWLEPGSQRLTGAQALGYSRSRVTTDDFSRMRRQRCMVAAVVDQVNPVTMLQRYPQIISAVGDNVVTDVPRSDLDEWAELTLQIQGGQMRSLPFTGSNTDTAHPNYSDIRMRVWDALYAVPAPASAAEAPEDVEQATADPAAATDEAVATTAPPADDAALTTEAEPPPDELEEIGAVCD